jgi:hypothetical protein
MWQFSKTCVDSAEEAKETVKKKNHTHIGKRFKDLDVSPTRQLMLPRDQRITFNAKNQKDPEKKRKKVSGPEEEITAAAEAEAQGRRRRSGIPVTRRRMAVPP